MIAIIVWVAIGLVLVGSVVALLLVRGGSPPPPPPQDRERSEEWPW